MKYINYNFIKKFLLQKKVRPAKENLVTETDKKAVIIGFSPQRIQSKIENGILTAKKYKYVKAI